MIRVRWPLGTAELAADLRALFQLAEDSAA
jgi:hypothetical protein